MKDTTNQPITELEPWWKDEPDLGVLQSSIGKRTKTKIVTREKTSYTKVKHTTYIPTGWGFGLRVNPMKESKKEKPIDPVKQAQRKAAKITKMQQRKTEQIQKQKEAKRKEAKRKEVKQKACERKEKQRLKWEAKDAKEQALREAEKITAHNLKTEKTAQRAKEKKDLEYERKNNPRFFFERRLKRRDIIVIEGQFACPNCGIDCLLTNYVDGDKILCPDCLGKTERDLRVKRQIQKTNRETNDPNFAQKNLKTNLLERVKAAKKRRPEGFALEPDWAVKQYEKQKGICFYTGFEMKVGKGSGWYSISVDRVDSAKGYSPENCVLCCFGFNSMKRDMPLDRLESACKAFLENKSNWNRG